ncbi:MAG TPA: GNAT family N-acetyltransferase, partial [Burkholderiales bacterium]|nr:GNAT family N-acetyltransferase [Burkholderiales bacterium]
YIDAAMASPWRKQLRRRERRLQERGKVQLVALSPGDDPRRWIDDFLRLEASGWKGRLGTALACSEGNRRFAVEALRAAAQRGRLHMVGVDFDGAPIARCCNLLAGEASYAFRTAYDEAFAAYSPGLMAEVHSIREFHALPSVAWMDSMTDPNNELLNRLWKHRRSYQTLLVGTGVWGELWTSTVPLLRWAKRRTRRVPEPMPAAGKGQSREPAWLA